MSTVLRRLYNVAYGRVRVWQEGSPDASELDEPVGPVRRAETGDADLDDAPAPEPSEPAPRTAPPTPRQRRL